MAVNSLFPSYVVINYHSAYGKHTMTIPTREWNAGIGVNDKGGYQAWDTADIDAVVMIEDLANSLAENFPSTVVFDGWIIYNYAAPDESPNPVAGGVFTDIAGTEATPGWSQAVQNQITMYDTDFNTFKIVMLDAASFDDFAKRTGATLHTGQQAVVASITDVGFAWSSRANARPDVVRSATTKLNDELRKQYDMA